MTDLTELKALAEKATPGECDWPRTGKFTLLDSPGEHDPCYVVMPDGAMIALNHHAGVGVDVARAKFIVSACNAFIAAANPAPALEMGEEIRRLREALRPFAELADDYGGGYADYDSAFVAVKHLRRARAAMEGK